MTFKKKLLATALLGFVTTTVAQAETEGWGTVAGGTDSGGWEAPTDTAEAPTTPTAPAGELACGADDPRYARLVPVLKDLQAGQSIESMQTSFSTYVTLNANVRQILGDNIYISTPDCTEQHLFNGALTGKVNVPFTDLWQVINEALRTDDAALMNFVAQNARVTPESALSVISMVQYVHLDQSQIRKLYTVIAPDKAKPTDIQTPLMLEVFLAFGGTVQESERGKTAYLDNRGAYTNFLDGIYLERRGGQVTPPGFQRVDNIVPQVSSMLRAAGLLTQTAADAQKLAEQ